MGARYPEKCCSLVYPVLVMHLFAAWSSVGQVEAMSLNDCGGYGADKYAEIVQGAKSTFNCTGITGQTIRWLIRYGGLPDPTPFGECALPTSPPDSANTCTLEGLADIDFFGISRSSPDYSLITVDPVKLPEDHRASLLGKGEFICEFSEQQSESCPMDYVVPAEGQCRVQYNTTTWTVESYCNITRGQSTRGRYACRWSRKESQDTTYHNRGKWETMENSTLGAASTRGCTLTSGELMPTEDGVYTYRVRMRPGRNFTLAKFIVGSGRVERPRPPTAHCRPEGFVPDNTNLQCTCSTTHIGTPGGHLRWSERRGGTFDTGNPFEVGGAGEEELVMEKVVREKDHDTHWRCDAVWAEEIVGGEVTVEVGVPAESVSLTPKQRKAKEGESVNFRCGAAGGRPSPNVTLTGIRGEELSTSETSLTLSLDDLDCPDSGNYTCTASNGMGKVVKDTVVLTVQCKPKEIDSSQLPQGHLINYIKQAKTFRFNVTASPPPSITFTLLNSSRPSAEVKGIDLSGQCRLREGQLYISTCEVTVDNVTASAVGLYQGTVRNRLGETNFTFEVKVNAIDPGPVGPLADDGFGVAVIIGVVIAVAVVVVLVAAFVYTRRRRGAKATANGNPTTEHPSLDPAVTASSPQPLSAQASAGEQPLLAAGAMDEQYAVVEKSKKKGSQPQEGEATATGEGETYSMVDKEKKKKKKKKGTKAKVKDTEATPEEEAPIYGNVEQAGGDPTQKPKTEEDPEGGRTVNPDGLVYVSVNFRNSPNNFPAPPPADVDQHVIYSTVDFAQQK